MRLARFLALAGVTSRRKAEDLIRSGRVLVNDDPVVDPAVNVDPSSDRVIADGEKITLPARFTYYLLNKPKGYVTSRNPQSHRTVFDLIPPEPRVSAAGRLDMDSEGLLILTNDGGLVNLLTHPRHGVPKTYRVRAEGELTPERLQMLMDGVRFAEGKARGKFRVLKRDREFTVMEVTIKQGLNRQVRRMLAKAGLKVRSLVRTAVGPLSLGRLPKGKWRELTAEELKSLRSSAKGGSKPGGKKTGKKHNRPGKKKAKEQAKKKQNRTRAGSSGKEQHKKRDKKQYKKRDKKRDKKRAGSQKKRQKRHPGE